jgi:hypothetical protein
MAVRISAVPASDTGREIKPPAHAGKYRVPRGGNVGWMVKPLSCRKCARQGNPGFIGDGTCYYCRNGIN